MSQSINRTQFEAWISASPYEKCIDRYPNNEHLFAWPGYYTHIDTQLAWEAWCAALNCEET